MPSIREKEIEEADIDNATFKLKKVKNLRRNMIKIETKNTFSDESVDLKKSESNRNMMTGKSLQYLPRIQKQDS